jgi:hypothetical protein
MVAWIGRQANLKKSEGQKQTIHPKSFAVFQDYDHGLSARACIRLAYSGR